MRHSEIIDLWPSLTAFAEDIGVEYGTAKAMRRRSSIPPGYWFRLIAAAAGRKIVGITADVLTLGVSIDAPQSQLATTTDCDHIPALRLPVQEAAE